MAIGGAVATAMLRRSFSRAPQKRRPGRLLCAHPVRAVRVNEPLEWLHRVRSSALRTSECVCRRSLRRVLLEFACCFAHGNTRRPLAGSDCWSRSARALDARRILAEWSCSNWRSQRTLAHCAVPVGASARCGTILASRTCVSCGAYLVCRVRAALALEHRVRHAGHVATQSPRASVAQLGDVLELPTELAPLDLTRVSRGGATCPCARCAPLMLRARSDRELAFMCAQRAIALEPTNSNFFLLLCGVLT